jgi:hypothetical protein
MLAGSPRARAVNPCSKHPFTYAEAEAALHKARRSPKGNRQERRLYRCPDCSGNVFHLTSDALSFEQKMRRQQRARRQP